jgi:hypothetical protein
MALRTCLVHLALAGAITAALPGEAHAWHESGHRIVARIAWDELTPAQQTFVSDLLVRHPRFAEDFVARMPDAIKTLAEGDAERRKWVFMHAAIWPDLIKEEVRSLGKQLAAAGGPDRAGVERRLADAKKYDNTTWHFDNKPIFVDPYALPPGPTAASVVGVALALPAAIKEIGDRGLPADRRAVALAWVIHLLGDSHQPLHSAAIFAADLLPQGDLGGNRLIVTTPDKRDAPTNLHALWDGLFGADEKAEPGLKRRVVASHPRRTLLAELTALAGASVEARVNLWLDESYRAADANVYTAEIRGALLAAPPAGAPSSVALDRRYVQAAKKVATRRVALAGYRLADCIGGAEAQR